MLLRHSRLFVEQENAGAALEKSVGGRETCEPAANNDDLSHYAKYGCMRAERGWRDEEVGEGAGHVHRYKGFVGPTEPLAGGM